MRKCQNCDHATVTQQTSVITRLLISIYLYLSFYFFTGDILLQSFISFIPLFLFYKNHCPNCHKISYSLINFSNNKQLVSKHFFDKIIYFSLPYFLVIMLLIFNFPQTGLGRIVYLPAVYFLNTTIIAFGIAITGYPNIKFKPLITLLSIVITILFTLVAYPQDSGKYIWELF